MLNLRVLAFAGAALGCCLAETRLARAQSASPVVYSFVDGSTVVGTVIAEDEATITIRSSLGDVRVLRGSVTSVQPIAAPTRVRLRPPTPPAVKASRLLLAGGLAFGVPYLVTTFLAVSETTWNPSWTLGLLPIAGPLFAVGPYSILVYGDVATLNPFAIFLTIVDIGAQLAGVILSIVGAVRWSNASSESPRIAVTPIVTRDLAVLTVAGAF